MNLTSPTDVRQLLRELNVRPSKVLGQNFLIDANIVGIILSHANLSQEDTVLEIGPGLGVLTEEMLRWAKKVIAIEKDARLCAFLRERLGDQPPLQLLEGDALDMDLAGLVARGVTKVVSNLPYAAGNRILVDLVNTQEPPAGLLVTVQRDVARRLAAPPGCADYGILTVCMQTAYSVKVLKEVSPTCFVPRPRVWSAVVGMERKPGPPPIGNRTFFLELIKWAFSQRRKQVGPVLRRAPCFVETRGLSSDDALRIVGIDPQSRPENISIEQWVELANTLAPTG